jgi:hypothetical protein
MTPLVWANFPVALLVILAWPGIPLRTAPGRPDSRLPLRRPRVRQRFTDADGIALNDPPAIRPRKMLRRRTTACHPERFRKERR